MREDKEGVRGGGRREKGEGGEEEEINLQTNLGLLRGSLREDVIPKEFTRSMGAQYCVREGGRGKGEGEGRRRNLPPERRGGNPPPG